MAATKHRVLVMDDLTGELESLVAVVSLGVGQRLVEDFTCNLRGCRFLEGADQFTRRFKAAGAFLLGTDIGGLQCKVDSPGRTVGLLGRHDLLAEQEPRFRSQLDAR